LPPTTTTTTTTTTTSTTTTSTVPAPTLTAWELVQADPSLRMVTAAIEDRPDLVLLLSGNDPLTLLLPTDTALADIPRWAEIAADDATFAEFLRGHIVAGELTGEQVIGAFELTTLSDEKLLIDRLAGTINGARFVTVDDAATNGYLHTVDGALVIPEVSAPDTVATTLAPGETVASTTTTVAG